MALLSKANFFTQLKVFVQQVFFSAGKGAIFQRAMHHSAVNSYIIMSPFELCGGV